MNYWLFKSEPDEYSLDDLRSEPGHIGRWDGIRNYQARNFLRDRVQQGDGVLFYHSACKVPAVVGTARVVRAAYPDPAQFDPESKYFDPKASPENPRWFCVDIEWQSAFARPVALKEIKQNPALEEMVLVKQGRLSIQPVTADEWSLLRRLGGAS
ncbi:EVE domain-containing protein [Microbulbifer hydrolyticus]|uniref:EVE domain-containing protein n=1 Tax=Microbulbifer hydrolyticus TaxID=48074 RepID=A0A6P1T567_9GAMM|nr:EVE domain-containing protein [Microbulbifer hydrolyticus]MBB5211367.1 putative RNA-binding protein with PUA-like domain [Microbulbifer hydrolyticus]QHQ37878.1 EVE domain-containing protein [Microbulbifer hydrolyticus]